MINGTTFRNLAHIPHGGCDAPNHVSWNYAWILGGGIKKLTIKQYEDFHLNDGPLPLIGDQHAYIFQFLIGTNNKKPVYICGEWYVKHRLNSDGTMDAEHRSDALATAVGMSFGDMSFGIAPSADDAGGDIIGTRRMARRRNEALHTWTPTDDAVQEMSRLLVRRGIPDLTKDQRK